MSHTKRSLSRRQFLGTVAAAAVVAGSESTSNVLSARSAASCAEHGCAARSDARVTNGRIHTMDAANTIATP